MDGIDTYFVGGAELTDADEEYLRMVVPKFDLEDFHRTTTEKEMKAYILAENLLITHIEN
jgi:hypothetical protein